MEGRVPSTMLMVFCDCKDTTQIDDLNHWYNTRHVPDVTASGSFVNATRYEVAGSFTGDTPPRFLALYESNVDDPLEAYKALNKSMQNEPVHRALAIKYFGLIERFGVYTAVNSRESKGLMIGIANCADAEKEHEFQRWYDDVHAADVVKSGYFWGRQRFRTLPGGNLTADFFAFYESDMPEPEASKAYMKWPDRNPELHNALDLKHVWQYNKIYSQAGMN